MYRLRHVFDPKNLLLETREDDNESCRLIEIGTTGRKTEARAGAVMGSITTTSGLIVPAVHRYGGSGQERRT